VIDFSTQTNLYWLQIETQGNHMSRWLFIFAAVAAFSGCSPSIPKGVIVTGKITKGGAAVTAPEGPVQLTLASTTQNAEGESTGSGAILKEDGTFRFEGAGKGVPPGTYRLHMLGDAGPGVDAFDGAYSGEKFVKEFEVPADKVGGEFDVGTIELNDLQPAS
jgi:hypothetical protein